MKKFPALVHVTYEAGTNGDDDYLLAFMDGVADIDPGSRCAIYKLVDEGTVQGPKSFVSKDVTKKGRKN